MSTVRGSTILLVEDDQSIRDIVSDVLCDDGYHVMTVDDGGAAIAALRRYRPPPDGLCMVLLDMMLPVADGLRVLQELALLGSYVPVVAMSADGAQLARARDAGAQSTLRKPFDLDRLIAVVERNCPHER
jgi:DNA-binding response OmpR family regulator